jgi:hypothetical protein
MAFEMGCLLFFSVSDFTTEGREKTEITEWMILHWILKLEI